MLSADDIDISAIVIEPPSQKSMLFVDDIHISAIIIEFSLEKLSMNDIELPPSLNH